MTVDFKWAVSTAQQSLTFVWHIHFPRLQKNYWAFSLLKTSITSYPTNAFYLPLLVVIEESNQTHLSTSHYECTNISIHILCLL